MASVEYITSRIEGKEAQIAKLKAKIARIKKAMDTNWEVNPYYYHESDMKWAVKDLEAAKVALEKLNADLVKAQEKEASRNIPAITNFLDGWKERMTSYYSKAIYEQHDMRVKVRTAYNKMSRAAFASEEYHKAQEDYKAINAEYQMNLSGKYEEKEVEEKFFDYTTRKYITKKVVRNVKVAEGKWEYARQYMSANLQEDLERLEKDLTAEYNRKYDFIIERTNEIVGQITDATHLLVQRVT